MLKIRNLTKTFFAGTPNEVRALRQIDLHIPEGCFAAIIGTNGSGKSTLLNAVAGAFPLDDGAIQLGATVDYAILITTRYEEELKRTHERLEAITVAVSESSQSILVSASTMFAATIGLAVMSSIGIISSLTMLIARGAVVSFLVVVVILPAVLVVGQPLYERLSIGWPHHTVKGE